MPQKKENQAGGATCVCVDRRGTVRGTRLSVAGNSSERNVWVRMTCSECDILSHCSSGCTITDCGAVSVCWSCSSTELQAPSSSEQEYPSEPIIKRRVGAQIGERQEKKKMCLSRCRAEPAASDGVRRG